MIFPMLPLSRDLSSEDNAIILMIGGKAQRDIAMEQKPFVSAISARALSHRQVWRC